MKYYIIIDGGGSGTRSILTDENAVLAESTAPSAKPSVVGFEQSGRMLFDLILQTCLEADVPFSRIKGVSIGMSGVWEAQECDLLRDKLYESANAQMYALPKVEVSSDAMMAYDAIFPEGRGILLISGTGSIAIARDEDGSICRVGGYGPVVGDEGSGAWIGRRAVSQVLRCCDGRSKPSMLMDKVAAELHLNLPSEARALAMMISNGEVQPAALAPLVFECASTGDRAAANILSSASDLLLQMVQALSRSLRLHQVKLCCMGGIAEHPLMVRRMKKQIQELGGIQWHEAEDSLIEGALRKLQDVESRA